MIDLAALLLFLGLVTVHAVSSRGPVPEVLAVSVLGGESQQEEASPSTGGGVMRAFMRGTSTLGTGSGSVNPVATVMASLIPFQRGGGAIPGRESNPKPPPGSGWRPSPVRGRARRRGRWSPQHKACRGAARRR